MDASQYINQAAFTKKPYNEEVIADLHAQIDDRYAYLNEHYPNMPKQIDIKLTNLFSKLNSYNLNPPNQEIEKPNNLSLPIIPNKPYDPVKIYCLDVLYIIRCADLKDMYVNPTYQIDTVLGFINSEINMYDNPHHNYPHNIKTLVKSQIRSLYDIFYTVPDCMQDDLLGLFKRSKINVVNKPKNNKIKYQDLIAQHNYPTRYQAKVKKNVQFKIRSAKNPNK
jgi:hypothetical protein